MDSSVQNTKRHHMGGPDAHVNLYHNSTQLIFFSLMMSEEFRSNIFQECMNMRAAMEVNGKKGDRYRKKYPDFTPFSWE